MTDYLELAKQALTRPSDFGWFGDDDMFITWGMTGPYWAINSDDTLSESNFRVLKRMAAEKFGDDENHLGPHLDIVGINHWGWGSMDAFICQVVKTDCAHDYLVEAVANGRGEYANKDHLDEDDLTDEFIWLCDTLSDLEYGYPVLDEDDYSELKWEQATDWFCQNIPFEVDAGFADEIIAWLSDNGIYIDEESWNDGDVYRAAYAVGADDREFANEEWEVWELLNPAAWNARRDKRMEEAGQQRFFDDWS